ncbi:MAG: hypothetical protein A2Y40_02885 [Candidatus Margulisbacteria bacterium GWF2_35_9]|nr:MAG: hypothetical protein A2Y40_02885 [Candidatus Margulisbacteria bacterium GWF2_35_9]
MRFTVLTLGCKVNQYESDQIKHQLSAGGNLFTKIGTECDLIVINTCSVTHIADRKGRQLIRKAEKNSPKATIVITGCSLENSSSNLPKLKNGLYLNKMDLSKTIQAMFCNNKSPKFVAEEESKNRKFMMVQNGCNYFCSYCLIPYLRRNIYSVNPSEIKKEMLQSLQCGVQEFVLTGINLGTYQFENINLLGLLKDITTIPGKYQIRLSSIEPNLVTPELLDFIIATPKIAPQLHIPLQGTTDKLLKEMKRRYTMLDYIELLDLIDHLPKTVTVTTDIIVGFPTETDADFNATIALLSSGRFMDVHLFSYSPRNGTLAYEMSPVFSDETKHSRMTQALETVKENKHRFLEKFIGKTVSVLIEEKKQGVYFGYSENYFRVKINNCDDSILNSFVNCTITRIFETPKMIGLEGQV